METVGGIPVECLTGELAGVWSGWRTLGDREVVREASAKGTHINLAQKCIASRRNCQLIDAQSYFYREVDVWVEELLDKQQVFRATHIINNVGKDPQENINLVCVNTRNKKLRDYLIQHLRKIEGLQEAQIEAWELIKFMENYKSEYLISDDPISGKSILEIIEIPEDHKTVLYTDLYFHSFEEKIAPKLSNKVSWDYLLMKNRVDLIHFWIDINYLNSETSIPCVDSRVTEALRNLFKNLKITDQMINYVEESSAADIVKELVLDHFSKYGVFSEKESTNVKIILTRLLNNKISPSRFKEVLSQSFSRIKTDKFLPKLNVDLYSRSYLEENQLLETDGKIQRLCASLESMTKGLDAAVSLENGILATIDYLSDDIIEYLKENPSILSSLIFLSVEKQRSGNISGVKILRDMLSEGKDITLSNSLVIPKNIYQNMLHGFPYLKIALLKDEARIQDATMYQLLHGFENFNLNRGFMWRQRTGQISTFLNDYLIRRYGHKEKLNYINYLKQGRPNMATRLLMHDQKKFHSDISSKMKYQASTEAHVFALRNLELTEITSACVCFIETIGVDSENLRLHLSIAKRVQEKLSTPTGKLLEAVMFADAMAFSILESNLERCFEFRITETLDENPHELITAIKDWDLNIRFARAHNSSLPDTFLEYFARKDLWFEFLLVGQIYTYPLDQMIKIAKKISNPNIRGHLLTCLKNPSLSKPVTITLGAGHEPRQSSSSKSGIRVSESQSVSSSDSSYLVPSTFNESENSICSSSDDLWITILKSHHSQDPPGSLLQTARYHRSPLLVVLASCYEPSSIPAYWCSWLVISTDDHKIISDYRDSLDRQVWTAESVLKLLKRLVASGYTKTMSRGLEIFMPENPLYLFANFLHKCVNLGDFESGKNNLRAFKTACSNLVCNINVGWNDTDLLCLKNSYWISLAGIKCTVMALAHSFHSRDSQLEFLKALTSCDFCSDIQDAPDFNLLLKVSKILIKTEVTINFGAISSNDDCNTLENEFRRCSAELSQRENYEDALELCKAANLDSAEIIIAQWREKFAENIEGKVPTNFWKNCANNFLKYNVSYEVAASFYFEHTEKVASHNERYEILKLAYETLKGTSANEEIINGVEMAMWKSCFLADPENLIFEEEEAPVIFDKLKTELMDDLTELKVCCELTELSEKIAVEKLIDRFIDAGNLKTALKIATIFNCKHRDLQILMLCLSLAEGEISPYELTTQQKLLLSTKTRLKNQWQAAYRGKGLQKISSINSMSQSSSSEGTELTTEIGTDVSSNSVLEKQDKVECITQLEKLIEILTHGVSVGKKILICYRLSAHLGKSYQSLLTLSNPIDFLEEIVQNQYDYKLEVIKDVIAAYQVNNKQITEFLASKIVATVTQHVEANNVDQPMSIWGYPLDASFHMITELCSEPSLLGLKLLESVTKLLGRSYGENRDVNTLKVIVELLIKSHDCFTASCNMEGIASILRKSQQLANSLQNLKLWGLLVRLLTGVGRFTEMNYILQILKENEQFEFLLTGKGLEKISGLKTALLDFLKRNCPEDKDLFNLVAHHFRLYSEIALTFEREAKQEISQLLRDAKIECRNLGVNLSRGELKLTKNGATENCLRLAMANYTHAAEYYLQDSKLTFAYQCCHRAELVALQTSFVNSVNQNQQVSCVLNLTGGEIDRMICNELSFAQANIILRAYNHPVDWGSVIYNQCILQCDAKYLRDFMNTNELTVAIVKDSAKRFQLEKLITKQMADSMQHLISLVTDVECKYTLASQLGFKNVIESILANSTVSAYLKDTVWRKGYSSTAFD